jgi:tungstate transport system ATP-binding protein
MDEKILEIRDLKKRFPGGFCLDISRLSVKANRIMVLIGPNGSGKSTLVKIINLLEKPESGNLFFKGMDILKKGSDPAFARKDMAAVFQEPLLFSSSVYSNIVMGLGFRGQDISQKMHLFEYLTEKLKLKPLLERNPRNLSSGEKQRVSLARALILEPSLLLLDEPLANIDQQSKEAIRRDLFEILKDLGRSAVYVTHDRLEAMVLADDIAVINRGSIEQQGPCEEVFRRPANEFVARFVGVDTLVKGRIDKYVNNTARIALTGKDGSIIHIFASSPVLDKKDVVVAIRPEDVILYSERIDSKKTSAMNFFGGEVKEILDIGIYKKVDIDCGFLLSAYVTSSSIERLAIRTGGSIYAAVKATSVHLF